MADGLILAAASMPRFARSLPRVEALLPSIGAAALQKTDDSEPRITRDTRRRGPSRTSLLRLVSASKNVGSR